MEKCNCIVESQDRVKELIRGTRQGKTIGEVVNEGYANASFMLNGEETDMVISTPYEVTFKRRKVDGTLEKKVTRIEMNILPNYCQFCGRKLKWDKPKDNKEG